MADEPVYTPPDGKHVDLPMWGEYDPPAGNRVALPMRADGYQPPPGQYVDLPLLEELEEWPGAHVPLPLGEDEGHIPAPPDGDEIGPAWVGSLSWLQTRPTALQQACSWGLLAGLEKQHALAHTDSRPKEKPSHVPWGNLRPRESHSSASWQDTLPREILNRAAWRHMLPTEIARSLLFRDTERLDALLAATWNLTGDLSTSRHISLRDGRPAEIGRAGPWLLGVMRHPDWRIPWGFGRQPQTLVPNPNIDDPPGPREPQPPVYIPPNGAHVDLPLQCKMMADVQTGSHISLPFRKYPCLRSSYVINNDVTLRRASDGEEVPCLSLDISGDLDSHSNTWSAQLALEGFSLVTPLDAGPVEVIAKINDQDHLLLLERFGLDEAFDATGGRTKTVRVQGRSISAELDEPYSAAKSRFETEQRTHWQLMQQELPVGTDWVLEAHEAWTDYPDNLTALVPGGTFSYTDLSPIQAIARVAEATGAVIQQIPGERKLLIVPRRLGRAWEWNDDPGDVEIDAGQMRSAAVEFTPAELANGIFVSGEENGVLVECARDGTGGDPWLEMVVDPLITHAQHGLQRGISELGATGKRTIHTVEIPVDQSEGGVIGTGRMINVIEDAETSWVGQSIAWSISATRSPDSGLEIWQQVAIERYRDD